MNTAKRHLSIVTPHNYMAFNRLLWVKYAIAIETVRHLFHHKSQYTLKYNEYIITGCFIALSCRANMRDLR